MWQFRVLSASFILTLGTWACGADWQEFAVKEGRFHIQLPGQPKSVTVPAAKDVDGNERPAVQLVVYEVDPTKAFVVSYFDIPAKDEISDEAAAKTLDSTRDGAIAAVKGTLGESQEIKLAEKHHGRNYTFTTESAGKGLQHRGRVYLVGKRLYQLIATWPADDATEEAAKFLDSFKLVE